MIFVNYVRNGIDPHPYLYTCVFVLHSNLYGCHCLFYLDVQYSRQTLSQIKKDIPVETAFYEQNKIALQENIETVEFALNNNSSLIPMYRSKEVLEQLIAYKKEGRARNDEDAIDILERERPVSIQPAFVCTKNRFATLKAFTAKLSRLGRFIGTVLFASLVAKSITRPIHRKVW